MHSRLCVAKSLEITKSRGTENELLVGLVSLILQPDELTLYSVLLTYSFTSGIGCLFRRLTTKSRF